MNYRLASILAPEAATTAATKTVDINLADPVSRLTVQMKGLNNSTTPTAHPAKMISKIELVDGSDVLFSLSGVECQALNFYDQGHMPLSCLNYLNNAYAMASFNLNFGRFLYDPVLALDPKKFSNPQLKITHNKALGGAVPDAGELSVFAHVFDQKAAAPTGLLMSKEQYGYTLAASAKEHIDLAVDLPYRKLVIMSMSATLQPWQQFNQVKLSQDNDRRVIYNDEKTSNLLKLLQMWPQFTESIATASKSGTQTIFHSASYERMGVLTGMAADSAAYFSETYGGAVAIVAGAAVDLNVLVTGHAPHGSLCIPFGKQDDIADAYDMKDVGNLRLSLTAGSSASGNCEIVTQQIRNY